MKFANVYRAIFSSRFALRLAFFSFLCLMVFAMSGSRLRVATAARATAPAALAQQKRAASGKSGVVNAKTNARVSAKAVAKAAAVKAAGEVEPATVCAQNQPINVGQINGTLDNADCADPIRQNGARVDEYTFNGAAGQQVAISMSANFDTFLFLLRPDGSVLEENDDINPEGTGAPPDTNSRIPVSGFIILPFSGTYSILATSFAPETRGAYSLTLSAGATCSLTPIAYGDQRQGTLNASDCTNSIEGDGTFVDLYTFNGTAGQQISITMTAASPGNVDPFLYLLLPNGELLADDDNGGGGTAARIPLGADFGRLPVTGTYTIVANTFQQSQSGNYNLTLTRGPDCVSTPITLGGTVNGALAGGDCRLLEDSSFIDAYSFTGTAGQQIIISMTSNTGTLVPALFLLSPSGSPLAIETAPSGSNTARVPAGTGMFTLPSSGTYTVLANSLTTGQTGDYTLRTQGAPCSYVVSPSVRPFRDDGGSGRFTVVTTDLCTWAATSNASWIAITSGASGTGTGRVRYTVAANTTGATRTGAITVNGVQHVITQTSAGTTPMIQFSAPTFTVNENDGSRAATITVTRTGDRNGAATIEYATVDDPAAVPCDPNVKRPDGSLYPQGAAYARCDYATTVDTLTFGIGEEVKTFTIPLINDVHVEGNETFQVSLSNPQGATLGSQSTATVTIQFDDTAQPTGNPINQTPFFVRMQYLDFLSREPEPNEPWSAILNNCPNRFNLDYRSPSAACDRIIVSQSFFGSPENRLKGFFVFLYYKASFGSANNPNYYPEYDQYAPDVRRVSGQTAEEVFAKRLDFSEDWVARTAFINAFADTVGNNAAFVDRLLSNLGITLTTVDPVSGQTRNSLVNSLDAGTRTRAEVLRIIVESAEATNAQFNRAFVAVQYYGYLRRTPDSGGYQAWLNVLNDPSIDPQARPRLMIDGFMNSTEYRFRFGPNTFQP